MDSVVVIAVHLVQLQVCFTQQHLNHLELAVVGRPVECSLTLKITDHGIITWLNHSFDHLYIPIRSCYDERSISVVIPQVLVAERKEAFDYFQISWK